MSCVILQHVQASWAEDDFSETIGTQATEVRLIFQLRRLTKELALSQDPVMVDMLYIQAIHEITTGFRVVGQQHALALAANQLFVETGYYKPAIHTAGCLLQFLQKRNQNEASPPGNSERGAVPPLLELLPFAMLADAIQYEMDRAASKQQARTQDGYSESDFDSDTSSLELHDGVSFDKWEQLVLNEFQAVSKGFSSRNGLGGGGRIRKSKFRLTPAASSERESQFAAKTKYILAACL